MTILIVTGTGTGVGKTIATAAVAAHARRAGVDVAVCKPVQTGCGSGAGDGDDDLAEVARLPGVRLVLVGDGPRARQLAAAMPTAVFLGQRTGTDLGRIVASLDLFVHPGFEARFF